MYLDAWMRAGTNRPDPDSSRLRCVSTTNYPQYLIKRWDNQAKQWRYPYYNTFFQMSWSSPETFDRAVDPQTEDDKARVAYVKRVQEYYDTINAFRKKKGLLLLLSPAKDYVNSKMPDEPERQKRWEWIAKVMQNRLEHVVDFSIGIVNQSGTYIGANNRAGQQKWGIDFIHIRSVDDDVHDGDRFLSVLGTPEVDLYPAKRVQDLNLGPGRDVKRSDTTTDPTSKKPRLSTSGVVDDTNQPGTSGTGGGSSASKQLASAGADLKQQGIKPPLAQSIYYSIRA
jgi:hypothetical protein